MKKIIFILGVGLVFGVLALVNGIEVVSNSLFITSISLSIFFLKKEINKKHKPHPISQTKLLARACIDSDLITTTDYFEKILEAFTEIDKDFLSTLNNQRTDPTSKFLLRRFIPKLSLKYEYSDIDYFESFERKLSDLSVDPITLICHWAEYSFTDNNTNLYLCSIKPNLKRNPVIRIVSIERVSKDSHKYKLTARELKDSPSDSRKPEGARRLQINVRAK